MKELKCSFTSTNCITVRHQKVKSKLVNVPDLSDVVTINNVLSTLNANVEYNKEEGAVLVDASTTLKEEAPYEYVSKMRASILVMGPLLARLGHAIVVPGGQLVHDQ